MFPKPAGEGINARGGLLNRSSGEIIPTRVTNARQRIGTRFFIRSLLIFKEAHETLR